MMVSRTKQMVQGRRNQQSFKTDESNKQTNGIQTIKQININLQFNETTNSRYFAKQT